ncbi:FxSxx-COOH system tetratricopeptide repeat protein [Catenulispora pinisilvae]|uniref:FxSxx-COOH system tetratricopeptide repeat protein n=1 Tax=Catenulispora pinisilvae TaxID=2705253 RepID=UPI001892125E|nr:FxSxx-COOH system tetratricopeptide repeat protein [Catenulispora pinisilvae]
MVGAELVVGYLFAWLVGKGKRAARQADAQVDKALDAAVDRLGGKLHELVAGKLVGDTALARLDEEAGQGAIEPSARTRARVALAIEDALESDVSFGEAVEELVRRLQTAQGVTIVAAGGVAVQGDVRVSAGPEGFAIGAAGSVQVVFQRRVATGQAVRLDPRPGRVAGREQLISQIHAHLGAAQEVGTVALCGLGGVGKTTAALEYAYRQLQHYQVVWFFHAEQATGLLAQFHELAQVLDAGEGDPVAAVHAALAAHPGRWLLVLDNVKDHAAARRWLPAKGAGHVLVTTQDGHWPSEQAVEVTALDAEDAAGLLLDRTMSTDRESARAIADELGLLPLALEQAAAFIETTGRSLDEYLGLLSANRAAVLARSAPASHAAPVVATWSLALTELEATSSESLTLLRIIAFLAPEDIPFRLLLPEGLELRLGGPDGDLDEILTQVRALCSGPLTLDDAVAGLRRYSLIGPPGATFSVHRLVQAVTRDQLRPQDLRAWRAVATALVESAVPQDIATPMMWRVCRLLFTHAQLVGDPFGAPVWRLASALGESGDYTTARTWWQSLAKAHESQRGIEHPDTLTARSNFAHWTGEAGGVLDARDLLRELVPLFGRVLGPEHPDTLTAQARLAAYTGKAGDAVAARDLFRQVLPVRERVLGAEHPKTLHMRSNFALWTGEVGGVVEARDQLRDLLPVLERVSGPEHPDTLTAMGRLAFYTGLAGDAVAARDLYSKLAPMLERVLGVEHPRTLHIRSSLARWTGEAGDPATARDLLGELLPMREHISGPEHPDSLNTRANLAYWTGEAGDAATARDMFRELIPVLESVSGPEHPNTRTARSNVAYWTQRVDIQRSKPEAQ